MCLTAVLAVKNPWLPERVAPIHMTRRGDTDRVDHPPNLFDTHQPLAQRPGVQLGQLDVGQPVHRRHRPANGVADAIRR